MKIYLIGKREATLVVLGCFVFCAVTAENSLSRALSLFFRKEYVCARVRILSEKKGKMIEEKELIKEILERREAQRTLPMNKQVYILLSLPTQKPGI